jgi:predicted Rossmann-fold nucleotide-binding protein
MTGRSDHPSHPVLRPRRVGVCGGGSIDPAAARFCEQFGWALAGEDGIVIATGGSKHYIGRPSEPATEWSVVTGALARLQQDGGSAERRIETLLPQEGSGDTVRFRIGKTVDLRNRSWQARRFTLVHSTDVLVAVQGGSGTQLQIDLALALERRCLPLPFTGGVARKRWDENRPLICQQFGLADEAALALESIDLATADEARLDEIAQGLVRLLVSSLKRKCFVMMPFSKEFDRLYAEVIEPAISNEGFEPVRTDRINLVGNALTVLKDAIGASDCALAVITRCNPNVMYELGLAHAQGKPAILLTEGEPEVSTLDLPFDLKNEYVIQYRSDYEGLRPTIENVLRELSQSR